MRHRAEAGKFVANAVPFFHLFHEVFYVVFQADVELDLLDAPLLLLLVRLLAALVQSGGMSFRGAAAGVL